MKIIPQDLLEEAVKRLVAEFEPEEIYLFGSHAWGSPTEDSDVDLLIIVAASQERSVNRIRRTHRCLGDLDFSKDVFVQTRQEFDRYQHLPVSIQYEILRRGIKLYG
jgi:predicted nucleotidyltransferase